MLRRPGALKAPAFLPGALDRLLLDQPLDQRERVIAVREHECGTLGGDFGGLAAKALADIDPAADRAAIARAGALAERALFKDDSVNAALRQFKRRRQPGIAAADNDDPRLARHRDRITGRGPISLPPKW